MKNCWKIVEWAIRKCMSVVLYIGKVTWNEEKWSQFFQFIKFGLVGLSNTIISYVTYLFFVWIGVFYLVANGIAFVISVLNSYYWNNKYVFTEDGETRSPWKTLIKTFISYGATGLVLNSLLLIFWIDVVHLSSYIAPIINLIITIPLNFIINKFWAFKSGEK